MIQFAQVKIEKWEKESPKSRQSTRIKTQEQASKNVIQSQLADQAVQTS